MINLLSKWNLWDCSHQELWLDHDMAHYNQLFSRQCCAIMRFAARLWLTGPHLHHRHHQQQQQQQQSWKWSWSMLTEWKNRNGFKWDLTSWSSAVRSVNVAAILQILSILSTHKVGQKNNLLAVEPQSSCSHTHTHTRCPENVQHLQPKHHNRRDHPTWWIDISASMTNVCLLAAPSCSCSIAVDPEPFLVSSAPGARHQGAMVRDISLATTPHTEGTVFSVSTASIATDTGVASTCTRANTTTPIPVVYVQYLQMYRYY